MRTLDSVDVGLGNVNDGFREHSEVTPPVIIGVNSA